MNRPTMFLERLLLDAEVQFRLSVQRDIDYINARYENEGMSFLTITLPTFCDSFDESLKEGRLVMFPTHFKRASRHKDYPAFMQGFLNRVFSCVDGSVLDEPCIETIRFIRQITRAFKKVLLPCSVSRIKSAFERYEENDRKVFSNSQLPSNNERFRSIVGYLWADLEVLSRELYCSPGRHGNGATAERLSYNGRYDLAEWPIRGDHAFPGSWFASSREDDTSRFSSIRWLTPSEEQPARVVAVPKTLKTMRIICVEPSYMMVRQQSILGPLTRYLEERAWFKSVRFSDQTVNQQLARIGSIDDSLATIDLSDASDLVSYDLVKRIFGGVAPTFLDYLDSSRTSASVLPEGKTVTLRKFASMGSALCFPVEAMVFFTIVMYAITKQDSARLSRALLEEIAASVSVYGDDIIVPSKYAESVQNELEAYGLKVNRSKSFTHGFFKESCGGDYYKGYDITPVYVRRPFWTGLVNKKNADVLAATTSLQNQLYERGYWRVCTALRDLIDRAVDQVPISRDDIGGVYYKSHFRTTNVRWSSSKCSYETQTLVFESPTMSDPVSTTFGALELSARRNNWYGDLPSQGETLTGDQAIRPYALKAKRRWVTQRATIW